MKYTKNLHNKLLLAGFEFVYEHTEFDLYYTVYKKGFVEVTVSDSHREVDIYIDAESEDLSHLSFEQLIKLDKLITKPKTNGKIN